MVFTLRGKPGSSYAITKLNDGSAIEPSMAFANARTTGLYLDADHGDIGVSGGDGTPAHPTVSFGQARGVYNTGDSLGLTGGGNLEGAVITHEKSGRVWKSHGVPNGRYHDVIWVDDLGLFVTADFDVGYIILSKDGEIWTTYNVGFRAIGIAWSPSLKLLVATGYGNVCTSNDAITWTIRGGSGSFVTWSSSANAFISIPWYNTNPGVYMSTDGITWTMTGLLNTQIHDIHANDTIIVAVGPSRIYTSTDGVLWTQRHSSSYNYRGVTYSEDLGVWVSASDSGRVARSEDDGLTWTDIEGVIGYSAAWCDGQFIVNFTTSSYTSPDGLTWTTHPNVLPNKTWYGSAWSPSLQKLAVVGWYTTQLYTSEARTTVTFPGDLHIDGTLEAQTVQAGSTVTGLQITDDQWAPIDDTAVVSNVGGYMVITGREFETGITVRVGITSASSVSVVSATEVRVHLPALATGSYTLEIVHANGTVTTIPNGVTYSPFPVWTSTNTLAGTSVNGMPFRFPLATSDSELTVATSNIALPAGAFVSQDGPLEGQSNIITLNGTVTSPTTDTLYTFDATVTDAENQDLASKSWSFQHVATYSSQFLGNAIVQSLDTAATSSTIDATNDSLTKVTGTGVSFASASGSSAVTAAGYVLDTDTATGWTTAADTYDAADGSYLGSTSTIVNGEAVGGEYIDLSLAQASQLSHLGLGPMTGSSVQMPATFTIAGSNDGVSWTLVSTHTSSPPYADSTTTVVPIGSESAFATYRLIVQTVGAGASIAGIGSVVAWTGGMPVLSYAHPVTLPDSTVMARAGTTVVHLDPVALTTKTIAVGLGPTTTPALLADGSVFWPSALGYTIGYRVGVDGSVTTVSGISADVSHARFQSSDGTVLMIPSVGTTAQTYDPATGNVENVGYSLSGSKAVREAMAVPGGILALPDAGVAGSLVTDGVVTSTVALFGDNYNESKLVASDGEVEASFGYSMSMNASGTRMVVGARYDDATGGTDSGAAYVFSLVDGSWVPDTKLVPSDSEANALFGHSVSMNASGGRVVVGARGDDATGGTDSGAAYVFSLVDGVWDQGVKIVPSDSEAYAYFGISMSMNAAGDRVVVGALYDDATGGPNSGAAYVFSLVDGTWVEDAKIVPSDSEANANFGSSTNMNAAGDRLVVGAFYDDATGGADSGAAYVFSLVDGGWVEDAKIVPSDSEASASFGISPSMNASGDRVVVGALYDDATGGTNSGAAYVFSLVDGSWVEDVKLVPNDSEANAFFGFSVSMNATGDRLVVGAYLDNAAGGTDSGAAYVFSLVDGEWVEDTKIVPSDSEADGRFGWSTSMNASGDRVGVGAYLDDANDLVDSGAAYVYDLSSAGRLAANGSALIAKGSTIKTYDLGAGSVTTTTYTPNTVSDMTVLDDGRVALSSGHNTLMVLDPSSDSITTVSAPSGAILGRGTRISTGKVWYEGGYVFDSGSSTQTPLTTTVGVSPFLNP